MVVSDKCDPVSFAQTPSVSGRAVLMPLGESGGAAGLEIVPAGAGALSVEVGVDSDVTKMLHWSAKRGR